jgi:Xaa-Pro aminopeptidase
MKKDIDNIMKKMKVHAIYAVGKANVDSTMYYLLNGITMYGHYIKKYGQSAYVVHSPIEREEALKTGLRTINTNTYDVRAIFEKYDDTIKANSFFIKVLFDKLKVKGTVAFYGNASLGMGYNYLRQLVKFNPRIKIYRDTKKTIIGMARETKDENEIHRITMAGRGVVHAFDTMVKMVQHMKVKNNTIMKDRKKPLTIGDLKAFLKRELFTRNLTPSAGLIVAQGRDAGVPHNAGGDRQKVKLGKTIVFDIFPQELGGGYFFDFTRTLCFGYAQEETRHLYQTVKESQDYTMKQIRVGKRTTDVEKSLCRFFEERGHPTFLSNPKTEVGYCHSLGHGLGLDVHESPFFNLLKTNKDVIRPGMVFTVEPGLYYPDKGYGVRLEDVVYVDAAGRVRNLTNYPRTLVVEM